MASSPRSRSCEEGNVSYSPPKLTVPVGARDHAEGPADAPVTLVEYGDYQCPYCGAAYPIVKRIQKELAGHLRFVFRNFPITNAHPNAEWAAETAEAVAVQGKFWPIHDFLYENQGSLGNEEFFRKYETKLGLDVARIGRETSEHAHAPRVQEDFMSGVRSGVNGTPTFFINGIRYDGYPEFRPLVDALTEAQKAPRGRK
jgi:protein-disulfide isomerase